MNLSEQMGNFQFNSESHRSSILTVVASDGIRECDWANGEESFALVF